MATYLVRRLFVGAITLLIITVVVFGLINSAPGGPAAIMSMTTSASDRAAMGAALGLNQPLPIRYVRWLGSALQGNLGTSYDFQQPVLSVIAERLPNTALLAGAALVLAAILGVLMGIAAALVRGTWIDTLISAVATLGLSLPDFWIGTVLVIIFAVALHWLPASGMTGTSATGADSGLLAHMVLPTAVLTVIFLPNMVRFTRSSMIEVLGKDYVRTARSKGLSPPRVVTRHALRNAAIPIVSMTGLLAATLLGGSAVVESVFAWPGIGRLTVQAAINRDYPMIMGVTLFVSALVILINLLIDLFYAILDPRIRYG
ncbi:MAG TPA: ABC transporter permease [Chloroflexota bacterium]|nr:ABC transporter permease [Chloroflexota bacterium]